MSLFNLPRTAEDTPSLSQGLSSSQFTQVAPSRDVTGVNLPNGAVHFKFDVSGDEWWVPSRSKFRIRLKITDDTGADNTPGNAIDLSDDIAPNMNWPSALWKSVQFRIKGDTIESIDDYLPQCDTLLKRLTKSKSQLDSQDNLLTWMSPSQCDRANLLSVDGLYSNHNMCWGQQRSLVSVGFTAADTYEAKAPVAAGSRTQEFVMVSVAGSDLLTTNLLQVGDILEVNVGVGVIGKAFQVIKIKTALTFDVLALNHIPVAAAAQIVGNFNLYRGQNQSPQRGGLEAEWNPELGVCNIDHALPAGSYEFVLNPRNTSDWMEYIIESAVSAKVQQTNFKVFITDIYYYAHTVRGPVVENDSYYLSLNCINANAENITSSNSSLQQKFFDVSESNYALAVAFQDQLATSPNTLRSITKFKIRPLEVAGAAAGSIDASYPSGELALKNFYVQYSGQQKPMPQLENDYKRADAPVTGPNNGYINNLYYDTMAYSGALWNQGGCESVTDYLERGLVYFATWPRDGRSRSTKVNVNYQFQNNLVENSGNVILFDFYKKQVIIEIREGRVVKVRMDKS